MIAPDRGDGAQVGMLSLDAITTAVALADSRQIERYGLRMTFTVEQARSEELRSCGDAFAEAFGDDPVYSYIWPDDDIRAKQLVHLFDERLPMIESPAQQIWVAREEDGALAAVSVWDTSGRYSQDEWAQMITQMSAVFGERLAAAATIMQTIDESRPLQPHWYLDDFATLSASRGLGAGRAVVENRIAYCDQHGIDIYGVCTKETTVGFYEKWGAVIAKEIRVPDGPLLWGMLRTAH
ncbi:GNAT family N-acetyltransferase [Nocardia tenerifensis]|nr:GNAT family N-acetyltransferase [Nocardia tenerifensis]